MEERNCYLIYKDGEKWKRSEGTIKTKYCEPEGSVIFKVDVGHGQIVYLPEENVFYSKDIADEYLKTMETIEHEAINRYPHCIGDCYTCEYFDHKGNCSAHEEIKCCMYCSSSESDRRISSENDLNYMAIGGRDTLLQKGYILYMKSGVSDQTAPVQILLQKWSEDIGRNVDIMRFTPKYCPMCGRLIKENLPFIGDKDERKA